MNATNAQAWRRQPHCRERKAINLDQHGRKVGTGSSGAHAATGLPTTCDQCTPDAYCLKLTHTSRAERLEAGMWPRLPDAKQQRDRKEVVCIAGAPYGPGVPGGREHGRQH